MECSLGAPEKSKIATEVDAVLLEPIQHQLFGKRKAVVAYVKLKVTLEYAEMVGFKPRYRSAYIWPGSMLSHF